MKFYFFKRSFLLVLIITIFNCGSYKNKITSQAENNKSTDTIAIVNKEAKYEIIIIDPGFNIWLQFSAEQRGYFSQNYLEIKNAFFVTSWNTRAIRPSITPQNLYTMEIEYDTSIDYGYEVNYLLYNYFVYFQQKHHQNLSHAI